MAVHNTPIDLSTLPAPAVIEPLDYEQILAARQARLMALTPAEDQAGLAAVLALESEPLNILLQENVERELILRARVNDAARATMLAYARGADLENLAAFFGVARLADESDARLRARTQLALEGYASAGPRLAYRYHALSAHRAVRDVMIDSPTPGTVRIVVLAEPSAPLPEDDPDADPDTNPGYNPGGVPGQALLAAVAAATNAEEVRPLCDTVEVVAAQVLTYTVEAQLVLTPGPGAVEVLAGARRAAAAYGEAQFLLGHDITVSGLKAALRAAGVARVNLNAPALSGGDDGVQQDVLIAVADHQAARCTQITVDAQEL